MILPAYASMWLKNYLIEFIFTSEDELKRSRMD